ncbi:MAG: FHA domain-containing protein [Anaerolineales bacterium]
MASHSEQLVCPSCQTENIPGTLFCVQCGTYLPSGGPLRTEPLPEQEGDDRSKRSADRGAQENGDEAINIEFEVLSSNRKVLLSAASEILFGRLDAAHGIFPEMDLTADGGLENGVSRRHARVYTRDGVCYVEDLDSTNGTFLNGERLTPYLPYKLHDGDVLTLGTLQIRAHFYAKS